MIGYLQAQIRNANNEISDLKPELKKLKEELENCIQLKPLLIKIGDDALSGYHSLQSAGNSLNRGMIIDGKGQGNKILEKSETINALSSDAKTAVENVKLRIKELEDRILEINNRIDRLNSSISGWNTEISKINQIRNNLGLKTKE